MIMNIIPGLELVRSLPLQFIQIIILDDRAQRLAVVTCTGTAWYYKMCSLRDSDDSPWMISKNAIAALYSLGKEGKFDIPRMYLFGNGHTSSRKSTRIDAVSNRCLLKKETQILQQRSYPFYCRLIDDAVIQTGLRNASSSFTRKARIPTSSQAKITLPDSLYRVCFDIRSGSALELGASELCPTRSKSCHDIDPISDVKFELTFAKPSRRSVSVPDLWSPRTEHKRSKTKDKRQWDEWEILKDCGFIYLERHKPRHCDDEYVLDKMDMFRKKYQARSTTCRRSCSSRSMRARVPDDGSSSSDSDELAVSSKPRKKARWRLNHKRGKVEAPKGKQNSRQSRKNVNQDCRSRNLDEPKYRPNKTLDFYPEELADQLTLIDIQQVRVLSQADVTRLAMTSTSTKHHRYQDIDAIGRMVEMTRFIPSLVATEILSQTTLNNRLECLKFFIKVAQNCWQMRNFNSFVNVMRGLQSYPVYSIHDTWGTLQDKEPSLTRVFSQMCGYVFTMRKDMCNFCMHTSACSVQTPEIPWLPKFVSSLVHVERNQFCQTCQFNQCIEKHPQKDKNWNCGESQSPSEKVPAKSILKFADSLSNEIVAVAVKSASLELSCMDNSSSTDTEGPDSSVDEIDAQAFDILNAQVPHLRLLHKHKAKKETSGAKQPKRKSVVEKGTGFFFESDSDESDNEMENGERKKSIFENVVAFLRNDGTEGRSSAHDRESSGNKHNSVLQSLMDCVKSSEDGNTPGDIEERSGSSLFDRVSRARHRGSVTVKTVLGKAANFAKNVSSMGVTTEETETSADDVGMTKKSAKKKSVRFLQTDSEESNDLDTKTGPRKRRKSVVDRVSDYFPMSTADESSGTSTSTRRKSVIDQMVDLTPFAQGQDKNGVRRKSVFDSVVDIVTGEESKEEEVEKSWRAVLAESRFIMDGKELEDFKETLEKDVRTPNSHSITEKRPIFNKTRTPWPLRLVGRLVNKKSQVTKSTWVDPWGDQYEEEEPQVEPTCPTPEQIARGSRRFSLGVVPTQDRQIKSLLSSLPTLPDLSILPNLRNLSSRNKNDNAKVKARIFRPRKTKSECLCGICLRVDCPHIEDVGKLLLEAHISAGKYNVEYKRESASFLLHRPVLPEHKLLEMIDHERLV